MMDRDFVASDTMDGRGSCASTRMVEPALVGSCS